jgi:CPA2 family monovalent cation:H+ antiporter-2
LSARLNDGGLAAADLFAITGAIALTLGKVAAFVAIMMFAGRRAVPWLLHHVVHSGSRELFRLAVLTIALGVAYAASAFFGISFALGALFAGFVMAESALSQQAANETLPLRDAFAVLFFVSVGMLFDPTVLLRDPWPLAAAVALIVLVRTAFSVAMLRLLGRPLPEAAAVSASRAQIGEFSFIVAGLGASLGLLPDAARDLVLGSAIVSICLTPAVTWAANRFAAMEIPAAPATRPARAVVVGHGRVGSVIAAELSALGAGYSVIELNENIAAELRTAGVSALFGNAASAELMRQAGVETADLLYVTTPDGFESGGIVSAARKLNPGIKIYVRAHSDAEVSHLEECGADVIISGERELADAMMAASKSMLRQPLPAGA